MKKYKPFIAGQRAFENPRFYIGENKGILIEENPYREGTQQNKEWEQGYTKAYFQNKNTLGNT